MRLTPHYVLSMDAKMFFSMRIEMLKQIRKERSIHYREICQIQAMVGVNNLDYYNDLMLGYREMGLEKEELENLNLKKERVFNADDPESSRYAANVLQGFFSAGVKRV